MFEWKNSKWLTKKSSANSQYFFHGLVLYLVELIDAKGIGLIFDVTNRLFDNIQVSNIYVTPLGILKKITTYNNRYLTYLFFNAA